MPLKPEDLTVLVVDDQLELASLICEELEMAGFKTLSASGGLKALQMVKNEKIDFILSDMRMPEGSGEELLENLQNLEIPTPLVMIMTGFSGVDKKNMQSKGAYNVLHKPIDVEYLTNVILSACQKNRVS